MSRASATGLMGLATICWGVSTVTTKVALAQLAPTDVFAIEVATATVVVWGALAVAGKAARPRAWRGFLLLGLLEPGLSFVLFDIGLARTGATDGAILIASEGVIGALLGWAVLGERVSAVGGAALGAGMAGSVLVTLQASGHGRSLLGDLLVLAASATAAAYGVGARRLAADTHPLGATAAQLLAATAMAVPVFAIAAASGHSHVQHVDAGHLVAALATGLFGGAVPFLLFNLAIRDVTVAGAALIANLIPLIATGLAVALLGERPAALQLVGGALVIAAAVASSEATEELEPPGSLA